MKTEFTIEYVSLNRERSSNMSGQRIEKFEDLIAWQKARELTKGIYKVTKHGGFLKDFGLRDQIRRSSVSIMSNLAEGFERGGRPEFYQFLVYAKGSCAELRSQLYVALDVEYIDVVTFQNLDNLARETSRLVGGLRAAVYRQKSKIE
jgi:four helix bundle protein